MPVYIVREGLNAIETLVGLLSKMWDWSVWMCEWIPLRLLEHLWS